MTAEGVPLAGTLFLSFVIVASVARQRTPNRLQKGLLVLSILSLSASLKAREPALIARETTSLVTERPLQRRERPPPEAA